MRKLIKFGITWRAAQFWNSLEGCSILEFPGGLLNFGISPEGCSEGNSARKFSGRNSVWCVKRRRKRNRRRRKERGRSSTSIPTSLTPTSTSSTPTPTSSTQHQHHQHHQHQHQHHQHH